MIDKRAGVVGFAATLAALTYIDRVCIAQAEPYLTQEFKLTREEMGYVFAAFVWGYALLEVPGGWLGDRIGAKRVLTRVVVWWSLFTAATGWTWNLGSLLVTRFLFGAGEAGCFPNLTKALKNWLPEGERVRAQSIVWLSARWGGAFTPPLAVFMLQYMNWRVMLLIFGSLGIGWAVLFHRRFRDHPGVAAGAGGADPAPRAAGTIPDQAVGPTPWKRMLGSPTVVLLCLQYMFLTYAWYFYVTWLSRYLTESRGVSKEEAALLCILPLFFGGLGCLACGFLSPLVIRWTGSVRTARRLLASSGFGGASILLLVSLRFEDPRWAMLAVGLAGFFNDFAMPVSWAACMDVGGRHTATLSGIMNMMGAVGGSCAPIVTVAILNRSGSNWALTFYASAVLYLLGLCCWLFLDPVTPLVPDRKSTTEGEKP